MKRYFYLLIALAYNCLADNFVINPGFDLTPWDSGWIKCKKLYEKNHCDGIARVETDCSKDIDFHSSPYSCKLFAKTYAAGYDGRGKGVVSIQQNIMKKVCSCTLKIFHKYSIKMRRGSYSYPSASCGILVYKNGKWENVWRIELINTTDTIISGWASLEKIYTPNDTITQIQFYCISYSNKPDNVPGDCESEVCYWIDDIYLGGRNTGNILPQPSGLLTNPKFDTIPWNLDWQLEVFPHPQWGDTSVDTEIYISKSNSANLFDMVSVIGGSFEDSNLLYFWPNFSNPIVNCTLSFYYTYSISSYVHPRNGGYIYSNVIFIKTNNDTIKSDLPLHDTIPGWLKFYQVFSDTDTIKSIKIKLTTKGKIWASPTHGCAPGINVFIDNVYLSGKQLSIEEKEDKINDAFDILFNIIKNHLIVKYVLKEKSKINIAIYDMVGREVIELINKEEEKGVYSINFDVQNLLNGVYFCRFYIRDKSFVKKFIIIK